MLGRTLVAPTPWHATTMRPPPKTMGHAIKCPVWCLGAPTPLLATLMRMQTTATALVNTPLVQVAPTTLHAITILKRQLQDLAMISIPATDARMLKLAITMPMQHSMTGPVRY